MSIVIKVENLSKQYRLGNVGLGTIGADLNRWYQTSLRGREDPYLKIGEENDRSQKGMSDYVWALKEINFEVNQGEVLGIIGRNGAGKSTLLKILSRTTSPTTGKVKMKGQVASLLEVGTGFHPELTGRENIFLNGAILGMTKREVKSKFDEIVDFAGVERYIDTPVKRYSSGMYVRLAFGVAAHLEPEILVVDEVLAVGDAEFQKKALGKMKDVSGKEGRTVLFVSHNMASIRSLCQKALILKNGQKAFLGDVEEAVSNYILADIHSNGVNLRDRTDREGDGRFLFTAINIFNNKNDKTNTIFCNEAVNFEIFYEYKSIDVSKIIASVGIKDRNNELIAFFSFDEMGFHLNNTSNRLMLNIPHLALRPENYSIWLFASYNSTAPVDFCDVIDDAESITILPVDFWIPGKMIRSRNTAFFKGEFSQPAQI
jgi:lipopolysaccharide transport system ATP-binding protein